jgi:hypothetical protein
VPVGSGVERRDVGLDNGPNVGAHGEVDISACLKTCLYGGCTPGSNSNQNWSCQYCSFVNVADMLEDFLNGRRATVGAHGSNSVTSDQVLATSIEAEDGPGVLQLIDLAVVENSPDPSIVDIL